MRKQYKELIVFLKKSNFSYKKDYENLLYKKNNIIIKINLIDIVILDLDESRTYTFTNETTSTLLIDFLIYLQKDYHPSI